MKGRVRIWQKLRKVVERKCGARRYKGKSIKNREREAHGARRRLQIGKNVGMKRPKGKTNGRKESKVYERRHGKWMKVANVHAASVPPL